MQNTSGQQVAVFDNWRNLEVNRNVNGFDDHVLVLNGDDPRVDLFTPDSIVVVRRKVEGEDWYTEYEGFHRTSQRDISESSQKIFTSYGRGFVDLLRRRIIAYHATTAYTLKGDPGETSMKEHVNENAGPAATVANTRLLNGITTGLTIEPNLARGTNWFGDRAYRNLLEVLQEIAKATGVDFDVIRTGDVTFEFRCYYPQRGTNRTSTVIFSPKGHSMVQPTYSLSRVEEVNTVVALGDDTATSRKTLVLDTTETVSSPWNQCEAAHDARQETTYNGLTTAAQYELEHAKAKEEFTFKVMQTHSLRYGRDYFLGDIVSAEMDNILKTRKISGVKIRVSEGKETIDFEFTNPFEL